MVTVGGQSRPGVKGGVLVTPSGEAIGSTTGPTFARGGGASDQEVAAAVAAEAAVSRQVEERRKAQEAVRIAELDRQAAVERANIEAQKQREITQAQNAEERKQIIDRAREAQRNTVLRNIRAKQTEELDLSRIEKVEVGRLETEAFNREAGITSADTPVEARRKAEAFIKQIPSPLGAIGTTPTGFLVQAPQSPAGEVVEFAGSTTPEGFEFIPTGFVEGAPGERVAVPPPTPRFGFVPLSLGLLQAPSVQAAGIAAGERDLELKAELERQQQIREGVSIPFIKSEIREGVGGAPPIVRGATSAGLFFVPESVEEASLFGLFPSAPKIVKTGVGALSTFQGVKTIRAGTTPEEIGEGIAELAIGGAILAPRARGAFEFITTRPPPKVPVPSIEPRVEPFVRQRATVIVRDKTGKILFELDRNTNKFILPGGGIERGENPKIAAAREFAEETGLKVRDLVKVEEIITGGEKQIVFEGKVDDFTGLRPQAAEVLQFKFLRPGKFTGPSADSPIGQKVGIFGFRNEVRVQDLIAASRADVLGNINVKMKTLTSSEKFQLEGLARDWGVRLFGEKATKDIPTDVIIKDYLLAKKGFGLTSLKIFPSQETFLRRGRQTFLKERIPSVSEQTILQRLTGKKPGTFKQFQETPSIEVAEKSRYNIPGEKALEFQDAGEQFLVRGSPNLLQTPEGKPVQDIGQEFTVLKKFFSRGEPFFFFQPPRSPRGEGFLGQSYLGLEAAEVPKYGFSLFGETPTIQVLRAKIGGRIVLTKKALAGVELEAGAPIAERLVLKKTLKPQRLAGRKVGVQELELAKVKEGELSQKQIEAGFSRLRNKPAELAKFKKLVKKQTGVDYTIKAQPRIIGETISSPSSFGTSRGALKASTSKKALVKREEAFTKIREEVSLAPSQELKTPVLEEPAIIAAEREMITTTEVPAETFRPEKPSEVQVPREFVEPPTVRRIGEPPSFLEGEPEIGKPPGPPPGVPRKPTEVLRSAIKKLEGKQGFDVVVGIGKKRKTIARNLPENKAINIGAEHITKNIRASFKLKPTGKKPKGKDVARINLDSATFRPSRTDPLRVVERKTKRLNVPKETSQIVKIREGKRARGQLKPRRKRGGFL